MKDKMGGKGKKGGKKEEMQHNVVVSSSSPRLKPAVSVQTLVLLTIHYGLSQDISWNGLHGYCGARHARLLGVTQVLVCWPFITLLEKEL